MRRGSTVTEASQSAPPLAKRCRILKAIHEAIVSFVDVELREARKARALNSYVGAPDGQLREVPARLQHARTKGPGLSCTCRIIPRPPAQQARSGRAQQCRR